MTMKLVETSTNVVITKSFLKISHITVWDQRLISGLEQKAVSQALMEYCFLIHSKAQCAERNSNRIANPFSKIFA